MKLSIIIFVGLALSLKVFSQQEYYYLRILHQDIESPAALHFDGKINVKGGVGFELNSNDNRLDEFVSGNLYFSKNKFAIQFSQSKTSYSAFSRATSNLSINKYYKINNKGTLSLGLSFKFMKTALDWNKLTWADQIDASLGFTKPTNQEKTGPPANSASFNIAILYYWLAENPFFIGSIIYDATQPYSGFYGSPGPGLNREIKIYGGRNLSIGSDEKVLTTLMYRKFGLISEFRLKEDFIYKEKYWLGMETNFKSSIELFAGYTPLKHLKSLLSLDFKPNLKSLNGNTSSLKFMIGYAL